MLSLGGSFLYKGGTFQKSTMHSEIINDGGVFTTTKWNGHVKMKVDSF